MNQDKTKKMFQDFQGAYFGKDVLPMPKGVTTANAHEKLCVNQVCQTVDLMVYELDMPNGGNLYHLLGAYLLDPKMRAKFDDLLLDYRFPREACLEKPIAGGSSC